MKIRGMLAINQKMTRWLGMANKIGGVTIVTNLAINKIVLSYRIEIGDKLLTD